MGFSVSGFGKASWLYLGRGSVRLPVAVSSSGGEAGRSARARSTFGSSQDLALAQVTAQAQTVRRRIAALDFPSGDQIGLIKVAQPSNRFRWTGQAESRATQTNYQSWVVNVSHAQTNRSQALDQTGTSDISAGDYTIKLTQGDNQPVYLDVTVDYDQPFADDNQAILRRLGRVIEAASDRLSAEVVFGTSLDDNGLETPTVSLLVANRQPGPLDRFTLEDEEGDLIQTLGLNSAAWSGQDLVYVQGSQRATPYQVMSTGYRQGQPGQSLTPRSVWRPAAANPQLNQSLTLSPSGTSDLPAGLYKFKLTQGQDSQELTFSIDYRSFSPDNNLSVLTRLAQVLESAQPDIEARASLGEALDEEDQPAQGVTLVAASQGQSFKLEDVQGDLMARLGLNRTSRPAQTTAAGQNGGRSSDQFSLDQTRLTTQVWETFSDLEKLTVKEAKGQVVGQVQAVAQEHNNFLTLLEAVGAYLKPTVGVNLTKDLLLNQNTYSQIGIEVSWRGRITVKSSLDSKLDQDTAQVRQGLLGQEGLLTVIDSRLGQALETGFDKYQTRRAGQVYNAAGSARSGFDPYSRAMVGRAGSQTADSFRNRQNLLLSVLV
ncbi:MAG: hypothetical protein JRJ59_00735 [Deltaproteobacteria bacterium]|nr:hypothetical protein [Deltaproteobacteria bacterium]